MSDDATGFTVITRRVLGNAQELPISPERFNNLQDATKNLFLALSIEEKFGLLADNYLDLESYLAHQALERTIHAESSWSPIIGVLHTTNRLLINLMSTCRMYLDQVPRDLKNMVGEQSELFRLYSAETKNQYDSHFEYRPMEALRNFAQHNALPVHELSFTNKRDDGDGLEISLIPYLVVDRIRSDGN